MTHPLTTDTQRACLRALASAAARVGFDTPLGHYSQAQATEVIEAVTMAYERSLHAQSEPRTKPKATLNADAPFDDPIPF